MAAFDAPSRAVEPAAALWIAPEKLKPWKRNPRDNAASVPRVAESIKRFGFGAPVVARLANSEIIAGHTRVLAALSLKLPLVPVRFMDVTEEDAHTLALADNRYVELTGWTADLPTLLQELQLPDLAVAGWTAAQLQKLLEPDRTLVTDDAIPAAPTNPVTKLGDVWQLGRHRLVCGDARDAAVVALALGGAQPFLMVTDPPYGVNYDPDWRNRAAAELAGASMPNKNSRRTGQVANDDCATWADAYRHFPGAVAYVWFGSLSADIVAADIDACGFERRSLIIWAKHHLAISRGHYHWQHEPCWYAVREGATAKWSGDRKQTTLWDNIPNREPTETRTNHSTQKPVECMARPMRHHGGSDDHVYDPFLGSGTTISAAEQLGRTAFGCELNPAYCDVIVERWQALSGGQAVRR